MSNLLSRTKISQLLVGALCVSAFIAPQLSQAAPPPVSISPNGQGRLLIIGDSLSVGTDYFGKLQTRIERLAIWPSVFIDDKSGRKASLAAPILEKQLTADTTAIVIALGTNDMISRTESWYPQYVIDLVMAKTRNLPVLWVNTEFSALGRRDWISRSVRFNRALVKAQARWPQLRIADWNTSFVPKAASRFIADGVHHVWQASRGCVNNFDDYDIYDFNIYDHNVNNYINRSTNHHSVIGLLHETVTVQPCAQLCPTKVQSH